MVGEYRPTLAEIVRPGTLSMLPCIKNTHVLRKRLIKLRATGQAQLDPFVTYCYLEGNGLAVLLAPVPISAVGGKKNRMTNEKSSGRISYERNAGLLSHTIYGRP